MNHLYDRPRFVEECSRLFARDLIGLDRCEPWVRTITVEFAGQCFHLCRKGVRLLRSNGLRQPFIECPKCHRWFRYLARYGPTGPFRCRLCLGLKYRRTTIAYRLRPIRDRRPVRPMRPPGFYDQFRRNRYNNATPL